MDLESKAMIKEMTLNAYKVFTPDIYKQLRQYTTTEIRLEILKVLQSHIMHKTSDALRSKLKRKRIRKAENALSYEEVIATFEDEDDSWLEGI